MLDIIDVARSGVRSLHIQRRVCRLFIDYVRVRVDVVIEMDMELEMEQFKDVM